MKINLLPEYIEISTENWKNLNVGTFVKLQIDDLKELFEIVKLMSKEKSEMIKEMEEIIELKKLEEIDRKLAANR